MGVKSVPTLRSYLEAADHYMHSVCILLLGEYLLMCQGILVPSSSEYAAHCLAVKMKAPNSFEKSGTTDPYPTRLKSLSKWLWEPHIFQCIVCLWFRWSRGSGAGRCHETRPRNWKTVAAMSQWSVPNFANNVKRTCSCCWEAVGAPYLPYCSGQPAAEVYNSAAHSVSHDTSQHGLWVDRSTHRGLWLPIWKLMSLRQWCWVCIVGK